MRNRRTLAGATTILLLVLVATLTACTGDSPVATSGPPNILLISLDALRADHLGSYGYNRPTSPFLDELATRGIRFSHASVNTHGTPPSHTTMLSSLYQETHTVGFGANTPEGRRDTIPAEVELVQEILQARNWQTIGVTGGGYMSGTFGFSRGFDFFSDKARSVAQGTTMLLEEINNAMNDGRPIFAMYHTYEIHSPYEPPPEYRTLFGTFESDISTKSKALVPLQANAGKHLEWSDFDFLESQYDGEIRYTDDVLREFFAELEAIGFLENSLVIITSDHGEEFGDHGGLLHRGTLFQELLHIPLIVVGTNVPERITDPQLVSLIDIAPTVLDAAGLDIPDAMEGRSLLGRTVEGPWTDQRIFAQYADRLYSVRTPRWKLIFKPRPHHIQLFDVQRDPAEKRNLVRFFPEVKLQLYGEIEAWRNSLPSLDITSEQTEAISGEKIEELKALGYIVEEP